jgi:hypothetical protein
MSAGHTVYSWLRSVYGKTLVNSDNMYPSIMQTDAFMAVTQVRLTLDRGPAA